MALTINRDSYRGDEMRLQSVGPTNKNWKPEDHGQPEKCGEVKALEYLATSVHELKNPLCTISLCLELLMHDPPKELTEEHQQCLAAIKISAEHMKGLLNDAGDFAKIKNGNMTIQLQKCEMRKLVNESIAIVRELALSYDISLIVSILDDCCINGDVTKLKQVIINIVRNAVNVTPPGGCVLISAEKTATGIRISVTDPGPGIAEEDLCRIFQPYVQVGQRKDKKFKGSGLGLYITKKNVELHNGKIWIESELGKGSRFVFTIPQWCLQ